MAELVRIGAVAKELGVPVHRLRRLADDGLIPFLREGGGHRYFDVGAVRTALAGAGAAIVAADWTDPDWTTTEPSSSLQEDVLWSRMAGDLLQDRMTVEAHAVANHTVTEMVNNAIDHARTAEVTLSAWMRGGDARFEVRDEGVGAFTNLRDTLELEDLYDALGQLTKGKTTTDPDHHPGEGIFFSSKAVDVFVLESAGLRWTVDNVRGDQAVGRSDVTRGTRVRWEMDPTSTTSLAEIFGAWTDDDYGFTKTRTVVRLFSTGVRFVSRSEAKRLMRGLEEFEEVQLDFTGVQEVGQGFVDEVLRVWAGQHRQTTLVPTGMEGPVEFMVRRGLPRAT